MILKIKLKKILNKYNSLYSLLGHELIKDWRVMSKLINSEKKKKFMSESLKKNKMKYNILSFDLIIEWNHEPLLKYI